MRIMHSENYIFHNELPSCYSYISCYLLITHSCYTKHALHEKCWNTEFFLVHIFLYSDWIRENTNQKKLLIWTLHAVTSFFLENTLLVLLRLFNSVSFTYSRSTTSIHNCKKLLTGMTVYFYVKCYVTNSDIPR